MNCHNFFLVITVYNVQPFSSSQFFQRQKLSITIWWKINLLQLSYVICMNEHFLIWCMYQIYSVWHALHTLHPGFGQPCGGNVQNRFRGIVTRKNITLLEDELLSFYNITKVQKSLLKINRSIFRFFLLHALVKK